MASARNNHGVRKMIERTLTADMFREWLDSCDDKMTVHMMHCNECAGAMAIRFQFPEYKKHSWALGFGYVYGTDEYTQREEIVAVDVVKNTILDVFHNSLEGGFSNKTPISYIRSIFEKKLAANVS